MPLPQYAKDLCFYLVGAAIIRGAACTVNDIMDRKFDAGVGESIEDSIVSDHSFDEPF